MPYVVRTVKPRSFSLKSINDFLLNNKVTITKTKAKRPFSLTQWCDEVPEELKIDFLRPAIITYLRGVKTDNMSYNHFTIPKKTGGVRHINEPNWKLKFYQREISRCLIQGAVPHCHTAAFAYCKNRSVLHCRRKHQLNNSNWFLHLDIKDFFGSLSPDFVYRMLRLIYPFSDLSVDEFKLIMDHLNHCFLNNGLPQGAISSPSISNTCMIPIDCELNKALGTKGFVYTRYADDIEISHRKHFNPKDVIEIVESVFEKFHAPFVLKKEKTHYGSVAGRNWGLGLMLNKDHKITLGHEKHKQLKAELFNVLMDAKTKGYSKELRTRALKISGKLSFFKYVEPDYASYVLSKLETKTGVKLKNITSYVESPTSNISFFDF